MIKKVWHYFYEFIVNPRQASEEIAIDRSGIWAGFWWVITFLFCYSVTVLIYYLLGHVPVSKPFLIIPLEKWYLVQTFTTLPIGLAGFLSYSGIAYLLCKAWQGKGNFDQTFASQAFTLFVPTFIFMWVPETLLAPVLIARGVTTIPWPDWVENLRVFVFPFIWIFIISAIALGKIHNMRWWQSIIIIIVSAVPMGGIMAVFIR